MALDFFNPPSPILLHSGGAYHFLIWQIARLEFFSKHTAALEKKGKEMRMAYYYSLVVIIFLVGLPSGVYVWLHNLLLHS